MIRNGNNGELLAMCLEDIPNLRRRGAKWRGSCPFHQDREPSFYVGVHQGREYFKCFGADCGHSGGVVTYRRLTGRKRAGPNPRIFTDVIIDDQPPELTPPPPEAMRDANAYFRAALRKHLRAMNYLTRRGIPEAKFDEHGLGYCPRDKGLFAYLTRKGYDEKDLAKWMLIRPQSKHAVHGGRVTIPHRTRHLPGQDFTWYTARLITDGNDRAPRYLHPLGPKPPLLSPPEPLGTVILVEGPFDMLALKIHGFRAAAVNGSPDDDYFAAALKSAGFPSIMALPDRDAAGRSWLESLRKAALRLNIPFLPLELAPLYEDPAQLAQGPEPGIEIRRMVSEARQQMAAHQGRDGTVGKDFREQSRMTV